MFNPGDLFQATKSDHAWVIKHDNENYNDIIVDGFYYNLGDIIMILSKYRENKYEIMEYKVLFLGKNTTHQRVGILNELMIKEMKRITPLVLSNNP